MPKQVADISRGGYVLADAEGGNPDVILIATGSEVGLATQAKATLDAAGLKTRVVSMPSTDVFDRQDADYRESVLPNAVRKRVAIEAGVTDFWRQYVGLDGAVIGIDTLRRLRAGRGAVSVLRHHRGESGGSGEVAGLSVRRNRTDNRRTVKKWSRHPGESRDPSRRAYLHLRATSVRSKWVPAFAGMTT